MDNVKKNMQGEQSVFTRPVVVVLLAGLCNLLWGSAIPMINTGYRLFGIESGQTATQIVFAGCRFFLAGALTLFFSSIGRRRVVLPRRGSGGNVVRLALVQTVAQYVFFYIGVAHTQSAKGAIIQGLHAFVSMLVACWVFRTERMDGRKWLGGALGVAGVVLVNWDSSGLGGGMSLLGEGFLLISMLACALSAGMIKQYGQTDDPVALSGGQFVLGGAAMIVCGLLAGGRLTQISLPAIGVLLYLALLSAVAYTLWAVLLKVNPVSRVAVFMFLQPVFGVLLSFLLVDSASGVPLARYAAALVLVCLSITIVNRGQRAGEKTTEKD